MSVFVTLWNRDGKPVEHNLPQTMLQAALNPCNDGMDCWFNENIALGHQHFWITPEEIGERQPLIESASNTVIVGSIKLSNRHAILGYLDIPLQDAQDLSDMRLVLMLYLFFGFNFLSKIMGEFAFIIWIADEQKIFAARDHLGQQDLVYYLDDDLLIMASSVSMILQHPVINKQINQTMIAKYLSLDFNDNVSTFYQSIYHLPPAHSMLVNQESCSIDRYWELNQRNSINLSDDYEYAEQFLQLITQAIESNLRSDYPVGVSLSGGLDSATIACLSAELLQKASPLHKGISTFSYVFEDFPRCDERKYILSTIGQMSKSEKVAIHFVYGDSLFPAPLHPDMEVSQDYPYADPFYLLNRGIFLAAKEANIRTILSGFGGDALYSGGKYFFADLIKQGRWSFAIKSYLENKDKVDVKKHLIDYGLRALVPLEIKRLLRVVFPIKRERQMWVDSSFSKEMGINEELIYPEQYSKFDLPGQRYRFYDLFLNGLSSGVTTNKQIAWKFGVEYQVPFLSLDLMAFVLSVPPEQVNLPGIPRRILRNAMVNKLPELVRRRSNKASLMDLYNTGVYDNSWNDVINTFTHPQVIQRGWINKEWLGLELSKAKCTQEGTILWIILCLELWLQKYWAQE